MKKSLLNLSISFVFLFITSPTGAQGQGAFAPRVVTADDYARAEKSMGYNTSLLVFRSGVRPNWISGERFWYRITTAEGSEFVMIDPATGARAPVFDQAKLAAALSTALAYIVFFQILRRSGATNVMLVTLLIPVTAILLGYLVLGEKISLREIAGALVIGSALLLIDGRVLKFFQR